MRDKTTPEDGARDAITAADAVARMAIESGLSLEPWQFDYLAHGDTVSVPIEQDVERARDAGDTVSVPIEQDVELCGVRHVSYRDPMHTHRCTIVLTDDPTHDAHDTHACYCGDWYHA